ncbi:hypothetical protein A0U40_00660 [[Bacillus] sp. KCTC 13219]|nr:hypothetical protein A0U40_00660 [[Bacillus] sp. KCTC 13219]
MIEKYTLDNLNQDNVSVSKQTYIDYQGQQYPIGELWRRAYINNNSGRQQIVNELPQAQVNAIMAVWGDEPTVDENAA